MRNFLQIAQNVDVLPLLLEVQRQPHLWDKNPCRLSRRGPHYESQDILLRCSDETKHHASGDWTTFVDKHISEWYSAADYFPSAKPIIFDLMHRVKAEMLGAVLIYKVEPGKQVFPHVDKGWHPEFYDKFNICLQSNPKAAFCYENEAMPQKQGDVHFFRNDVTHWVVNEGDTDHIVLTVCLRTDRGYRVPFSPEGWTMDKHLDMKEKLCQQRG